MKNYSLYLYILILISFNNCLSFDRYVLKARPEVVCKSQQILFTQVGVTEATNKNDGPQINAYQKAAGIRQGTSKVQGDPYCMGFQYWCFWEACNQLKIPYSFIPVPRTGSSQVPFDYARKNGKKKGLYPEVNDLFIWKQKTAYQGHIARITKIDQKGWVTTIEGNTSPGSTGSQRDGGGVYQRRRNYLSPIGSMLVRGFVGFE